MKECNVQRWDEKKGVDGAVLIPAEGPRTRRNAMRKQYDVR